MKKYKFNAWIIRALILFIYLSFLAVSGCSSDDDDDDNTGPVDNPQPQVSWTIMVYGDGDNDLESALLLDIDEMKAGFVDDQGLYLIVLADRGGYSLSTTGFGEYFTDTRLYRITYNTATRISGGTAFPQITATSNYEANMGDALTLQKFIQACQKNYPADHYALILWNHGSGPMKKGISDETLNMNNSPFKAICYDETSDDDPLYTAEITDILTASESVDLLGFDACIMGSVEVAYQYRPGNGSFEADYMVASPANEWGYGWEYQKILERLKSGGGDNGETNNVTESGSESYYDPASMTTKQLGEVIVEEQYDSTQVIINSESEKQTLSLYDLSKVEAVKTDVDTLAVSLADEDEMDDFEAIRGTGNDPTTLHYFDGSDEEQWIGWPFFDLYDLCERTNTSINFSGTIQDYASDVMTAVDNMIVYSFAGTYFSEFTNQGKNGLFIFFPDGDTLYDHPTYGLTPHWAFQWWYNSIYIGDQAYYGILSWCGDPDTIGGNDTVENWFEMLDSWFDINNNSEGGYNGYQY